MSDWNIPKEYLDQSKEIERLKAKVAKLEAALLQIRNHSRPEARETQSQATVRGFVRKIDAIAKEALANSGVL